MGNNVTKQGDILAQNPREGMERIKYQYIDDMSHLEVEKHTTKEGFNDIVK